MTDVSMALAPSVYSRLRDIATARGESVSELMTEAAYRMARTDLGSDEVGVLWGLGFTDRQIAYELDWTNAKVSTRRRALSLPANKPMKGTIR